MQRACVFTSRPTTRRWRRSWTWCCRTRALESGRPLNASFIGKMTGEMIPGGSILRHLLMPNNLENAVILASHLHVTFTRMVFAWAPNPRLHLLPSKSLNAPVLCQKNKSNFACKLAEVKTYFIQNCESSKQKVFEFSRQKSTLKSKTIFDFFELLLTNFMNLNLVSLINLIISSTALWVILAFWDIFGDIFETYMVTLIDLFQLIPQALITPVAGMPVIAARVPLPIVHPTAPQSPESVARRPFAPAWRPTPPS